MTPSFPKQTVRPRALPRLLDPQIDPIGADVRKIARADLVRKIARADLLWDEPR
jgi:hypothetical protein